MNVMDVSPKDRAANAAAVYLPPQEGDGPDSLYLPPRVLLSGAYLEFYVRDGVLVLSVETRDASPEVFRLIGSEDEATVPLAISLGEGRPLVQAAMPGQESYTGRRRKIGA